jgi:hypothetical protein
MLINAISHSYNFIYRFASEMLKVIASNAVDRGFQSLANCFSMMMMMIALYTSRSVGSL